MLDPATELFMRLGRDAGQGGVGIVHISAVEPDPNTFRHQYYYNARSNVLFMKICREDGFCFWKRINTPSIRLKGPPRPFIDLQMIS
jgi:hypothetical protein